MAYVAGAAARALARARAAATPTTRLASRPTPWIIEDDSAYRKWQADEVEARHRSVTTPRLVPRVAVSSKIGSSIHERLAWKPVHQITFAALEHAAVVEHGLDRRARDVTRPTRCDARRRQLDFGFWRISAARRCMLRRARLAADRRRDREHTVKDHAQQKRASNTCAPNQLSTRTGPAPCPARPARSVPWQPAPARSRRPSCRADDQHATGRAAAQGSCSRPSASARCPGQLARELRRCAASGSRPSRPPPGRPRAVASSASTTKPFALRVSAVHVRPMRTGNSKCAA